MRYLLYVCHYNLLFITNCSWILTIHKERILRKKPLKWLNWHSKIGFKMNKPWLIMPLIQYFKSFYFLNFVLWTEIIWGLETGIIKVRNGWPQLLRDATIFVVVVVSMIWMDPCPTKIRIWGEGFFTLWMLYHPGFFYVKKTREVAFWTFIRR